MLIDANIRPSGFGRVVECPGSRRMEAKAPASANVSSWYAKEGTAAHLLTSTCLETNTIPLEYYGDVITVPEGDQFPVNMEMVIAVHIMVDFCRKLIAKADWYTIEERLIIPGLDMNKGGTGDFIALVGNTLWVVDLKYGRGITVYPEGNAQFLSYGWGSINTMPQSAANKVERIMLICIQPRQPDPIRPWYLSRDDMSHWLRNIARPAVTAENQVRTLFASIERIVTIG